MQMNWDDFQYFLALNRAGTLKQASRTLRVDQATVGRRIGMLEETLKTQLFEKSSDGYHLTVAGERIKPLILEVETALLSVERRIQGQDEKAEGILRVALPGALANHWLIPRMKPFQQKNPLVEVHFLTGGEVLNLSRREADLALRLVRPKQADLISKKMGVVELAVFGSKKLFQSEAIPKRPADLAYLPFIGLYANAMSAVERLLFKNLEENLNVTMKSAAWSSVYSAISSGLGIGILPTFMSEGKADLVRVNCVNSVPATLWLVVHPDLRKSGKVKAFSEFLTTIFV